MEVSLCDIYIKMQKYDIYERVTVFVVKIIKFSEKLSKSFSGRIIAKQMIRSASSVGANMQEADGATSKKDFINKVGISRKEAQETRYWLDLLKRANLIGNQQNVEELQFLFSECDQIARILSSIINSAREGEGENV